MLNGRMWLGLAGVVLWVSAAGAADISDLGRVVVTPERYVQDAAQAPSYVSIITADKIAASGAINLPELLARETGVHLYNMGSQKNSVIDIGGYNDFAVSNVLVLLNGRRINPSDSSGPDLSQVPLELVDRIEIIRGGSSVLYGDNAVGGVVNIVTRKGQTKTSTAMVSEIGSYGLRKGSLAVSGGNKNITMYVFGAAEKTNGYRANNRFQSGDGQVNLDWKTTPLLSLGMEAGWHEDSYGLPSGLRLSQIDGLGRRGTRQPLDYGETRDRYLRLTSDWTPLDEHGDFGVMSLEYSHRDRDTYAFFDFGAPDWQTNKMGILNDSAALKYVINGKLLDRTVHLATGVDFSDDRNHILYQYNNLFLPAYQDSLITKIEQGYYFHVTDEVLEHLTVDAGGRYQREKYVFRRYDAGTSIEKKPSASVWGGGLKYDYAPGSNVFVRADETFRFLNTDEWYDRWGNGINPDLRHQSGIDYRAGIRHSLGDMAELRLTPFVTRNKNEIFFDPSLASGFGSTSNYGHTQRRGCDLGQTLHLSPLVKVNWLKRADINMDYTFLDAQFKGGSFDGNQMPLAPEHQLALGLDTATQGGLSWNIMGKFLGSQFGINDETNSRPKIKPSMVVDTRFGYEWRKGWESYIGVNNLFDERYYDYVAYSASSPNVDYYPAMDRNYVVGTKIKF